MINLLIGSGGIRSVRKNLFLKFL